MRLLNLQGILAVIGILVRIKLFIEIIISNVSNIPFHNNFQHGIKRQLTGSNQFSHQPQNKAQRINNINEDSFLGQELDCPTSLGQPQQGEDVQF